jgi:hypothetical protein
MCATLHRDQIRSSARGLENKRPAEENVEWWWSRASAAYAAQSHLSNELHIDVV